MQQSRVISCAWPHGPIRTVAFILSLVPCPTRFVTRLVEWPFFFAASRRGQLARWLLYIRYCLSLPGIGSRQKEGLFILPCSCRGPWCSAQRIKIYMIAGGNHTATNALDAPPNSIRSNTISCRAGPWSRRCEFAERRRKFQTRPARREQAPALRMLNFCGSGELTNACRGGTMFP